MAAKSPRWPWAGAAVWLVAGICLADPRLQLDLDRLRYGQVRLNGVLINLGSPQGYRLTLSSLHLPFAPRLLDRLTLDCPTGRFGTAALECYKGHLALYLPHLGQSLSASTTFALTPTSAQVSLAPIRFAGGHMQLKADYLSGRLNLQLSGNNLNLHDSGFTRVAQQLGFSLQLSSRRVKGRWTSSLELEIPQGEGLYLPIYLPFREHPLRLASGFSWHRQKGRLVLENLHLSQQRILNATAQVRLDHGVLTRLTTTFAGDLPASFRLYGQPFLEGGRWEGIEVKSGKVRGHFKITSRRQAMSTIQLDRVVLTDRERRLGLNQLGARLSWQSSGDPPLSHLSWHAGHLYAIPVGAAALVFRLSGDGFRLLPPADLPILDGRLIIDQLEMLDLSTAPKVRFRGRLATISLEVLSRVLGWPPLRGTLSGNIPQVSYDHRRRTLELDGRLTVEAFSGTIVIERLAITDLFGALPRLQAEVHVHDLDLEQLTGRFAFGRITGRLEGHIRQLQLENWRPIAFDAWFGTPSGDRTRHRISQKAVENLAKLGGGFAAGLLSRTLLRVFDEFSYTRIGLGCRLKDSVCELSGVAPARGGYHIVVGGGLPRIDVIGYNRRIDWPTLMTRLARILQLEQLTLTVQP